MHPIPHSVWRAPSGAAVVTMPAQIDEADCAQVHAVLMRAVRSGATVVIVDLTRTGFCGYSVAEALVRAQTRAAQDGVRLKVAASAGKALLIGQIAGAGHQLDFYHDLESALADRRMRGMGQGRDHSRLAG